MDNYQSTNNEPRINVQKTHRGFDLEERTFQFAKKATLALKTVPGNAVNFEFVKQAVRSCGSVGANYIEANEALSKKDFLMRIKICRKEVKEFIYWIKLISQTNQKDMSANFEELTAEAVELKKIFCSIIDKCK